MPLYNQEIEDQRIDKELVLTDAEVAQMLKVSPETHWFRVVHETSRDAAPWAIVRIQAIKRN